jgi:hypothetical protein
MSKNKKTKKLKTPFGTVIESLSSNQKKALDQLLFSATEPSIHANTPDLSAPRNGRTLPQNEAKSDHLLIKKFSLKKNMTTGSWEIESIETNKGSFGTGEDQTSKIDQSLLRSVAAHLKQVTEQDLVDFIESEE